MKTYNYSGYYFDIHTESPLEEEGFLTGEYGTLFFRRCADGLSVYDSTFLGSGFVGWPTSKVIGCPGTINEIPVTELHQKIKINSKYPIAVEGRDLKRVYFQIERLTLEEEMSSYESPLSCLLSYMLKEQDDDLPDKKFLEISFDFCNNRQSVDFCEIQSSQNCILKKISAIDLRVNAPVVVLSGKAFGMLESVKFFGKVYPYIESGWDIDFPHINYFESCKNLKYVDGSLRGDSCWLFTDCESLEKVHLSNGILNIPPHAFENCKSLVDLYVPDTVTEIGEYAFANCENLRTIHLPNNICAIPKGLFKGCKSLTKCFLSDNIKVIGDYAFSGCVSMRKPWIPKSIEQISESAFDNPDWNKIF